MGTCTASQCPHDLHRPAQLGGLDPIMPLIPAMLFSYKDSDKIREREKHCKKLSQQDTEHV